MKSEPVIRMSGRANLDLIECYANLGSRGPLAPRRFRRTAVKTFQALACRLDMGAPHESANPSLTGLRCASVLRFGYHLIFYRPIDDGIEVIRVLHALRDIPELSEDGG